MKANAILKRNLAIAPIVIIGLLPVVGCGNNGAPRTLAEQRKEVLGSPPPPDVVANIRAQYSPGGAEYQKIHGASGTEAAGAALQKQGGNTAQPAQPAKPAQTP